MWGSAENAGHENAGLENPKMTDKMSGVENAGLENDEQEFDRYKKMKDNNV